MPSTQAGIVAPPRRTFRKATINSTGRSSAAWNKKRDNATKPKAYGVPRYLKTAVKAILDQQAEWKLTRGASETTARGTVAAADVAQWMPGISQGTTNGTRIGTEINIKSAKFDILIAPFNSATVQPFKCRILIFRPQDKGNRAFDATMAAAFYDSGAATFAGTGDWVDTVAIPNPEYFEVLYDKVTPVMQWQSNAPVDGSSATNSKVIANSYHYSVDIPYACGKLKYADADTTPSKFLWILVQAVNISGTGNQNAAGTATADVFIQGSFEYLDA